MFSHSNLCTFFFGIYENILFLYSLMKSTLSMNLWNISFTIAYLLITLHVRWKVWLVHWLHSYIFVRFCNIILIFQYPQTLSIYMFTKTPKTYWTTVSLFKTQDAPFGSSHVLKPKKTAIILYVQDQSNYEYLAFIILSWSNFLRIPDHPCCLRMCKNCGFFLIRKLR